MSHSDRDQPDSARGAGGSLAGTLLVDRYRLISLIANGGMAQVWSGHDRVLGRDVAVKVLHQHLGDDAVFVERFRNEAVAAARLTHPSIVSIFDVCSDANREAIVMELVRGESLRQRLNRDGVLSRAKAILWGSQVAEALEVAHRQRIVHRDIKPANILIVDDERIKVTDFGIAKAMTGADLTETGMMMGTAKYLAPEQVAGTGVDGRSDLYSLGVVLYESVCGTPPFVADSDTATALMRLQRDPIPPIQLRAEVGGRLNDLIMTALRREPDDRFESAAQMAAELHALEDLGRPGDAARSAATETWRRSDSDPMVVLGGKTRVSPIPPQPTDEASQAVPTGRGDLGERGPDPQAPPATRVHQLPQNDAHRDSRLGDDGFDARRDDRLEHDGYRDRHGEGDNGYRDVDDTASEETRVRAGTIGLGAAAALIVVGLGVAGALLGGTDIGADWANSIRDLVGLDRDEPSETVEEAAPVVSAMSSYDPLGDRSELDSLMGNLNDGDTGTTWRTERYRNNRDFGGLKSSVGVRIGLGEAQRVSAITLISPRGGYDVEVYATETAGGDDLTTWGDPVAGKEDVDERTTFDVERSASEILVLVTRLEPEATPDGRYLAEIAEIELR